MKYILAILLGFLILGPLGSIIGVLIVGFGSLRPPKCRVAGEGVPGHSRLCGCKRCYK